MYETSSQVYFQITLFEFCYIVTVACSICHIKRVTKKYYLNILHNIFISIMYTQQRRYLKGSVSWKTVKNLLRSLK